MEKQNFEGQGIMDCSIDKLKEICLRFLQRMDDFQQLAGDKEKDDIAEEFTQLYHALEGAVLFIRDSGNDLTKDTRNQIRLVIKHSERLAVTEGLLSPCPELTY